MSVCVVIPTLNAMPYVQQCFASLLIQTYPPDEISIVDGFSTDATWDFICNFRKANPARRILMMASEPRGMANARNIAISATRCDYVVPLDADDWIEPTFIERCLAEMRPGVGIVATSLRWDDSAIVQHPKTPITREHLLQENCLFGCSMFRRSDWVEVGGYDEHRRTYEDWEFWLRIVSAFRKVAVIREPLLNHRPHAESSSARMSPGDHEEYVRYIREKHQRAPSSNWK